MVGWEFPPFHTGGLGVHSYEISKEIARLGHRLIFVTPFDRQYVQSPGVEFLTEGLNPRPAEGAESGSYDLGDFYGEDLRAFVDRYNDWVGALTSTVGPVDVVHVHDWFGTIGAAALARRMGAPLVMTVHSTELDRSLGHPHTPIYEREWIGVHTADRVIAVSRHLADQLVRDYGVDADKIRVVYNAVRDAKRHPASDRTGDIVLFLGRLTAMKAPAVFVRAAARIASSFPDITFAIAGEGPEYEPLVRLAVSLGIGDRVLFLGKVTDEERTALLRDAAVFVLPSVTEPFGIAALEAMAAGVPTIVSKTSGVTEVVSSLFQVDFWDVDEFASRMAELLEYSPLRTEMGDRGREEATLEGWPERARQTVAVYREAIDAREGKG
jgi:glycosyltransferase involved in cell wall biosynthesis